MSAARGLGCNVLYLAQQVRGSGGSEIRRLRQLEEENRRLKSIVEDQALDIRALKNVLAKTATARGEAADGSGSNDHPRAVAASRLWADRDHATRVPARAGGRPQPRVAATLA